MFRSITWCYRHYLYILKNPFQNALYMYLESNFSMSKSVLDIHVEERRKLFKKLLESAEFCISTTLRRDMHIEKLLRLCVPKVSYWATTICIGACYCEELCTNQLHQSRIVVRFNYTLVDSCTLKKSTKKSSPTRLDMGLDRSIGSTIGS